MSDPYVYVVFRAPATVYLKGSVALKQGLWSIYLLGGRTRYGPWPPFHGCFGL